MLMALSQNHEIKHENAFLRHKNAWMVVTVRLAIYVFAIQESSLPLKRDTLGFDEYQIWQF